MISSLTKYLSVYVASIFKFIGGPLLGPHEGLSIIETSLCTILGMMTAVVVITYVGKNLRDALIRRKIRRGKYKVFSRRKRRIVSVFKKFGITGIAFLTPLILTPIGGTVIAVSLGVNRYKIITYMFVSALFWAPIASYFFAKLQPVFFPYLRIAGI